MFSERRRRKLIVSLGTSSRHNPAGGQGAPGDAAPPARQHSHRRRPFSREGPRVSGPGEPSQPAAVMCDTIRLIRVHRILAFWSDPYHNCMLFLFMVRRSTAAKATSSKLFTSAFWNSRRLCCSASRTLSTVPATDTDREADALLFPPFGGPGFRTGRPQKITSHRRALHLATHADLA